MANERSRLETERRLKETQKQTQELIDKHNEKLKHNRGNSNNAMNSISKVALVSISDIQNIDKGGSGSKTTVLKGSMTSKISPNTTAKDLPNTNGGIAKQTTAASNATAKATATSVAIAATKTTCKTVAVSASKPLISVAAVAPTVQQAKTLGVAVMPSVKSSNATNTLNKTFDREGNAERLVYS